MSKEIGVYSYGVKRKQWQFSEGILTNLIQKMTNYEDYALIGKEGVITISTNTEG